MHGDRVIPLEERLDTLERRTRVELACVGALLVLHVTELGPLLSGVRFLIGAAVGHRFA